MTDQPVQTPPLVVSAPAPDFSNRLKWMGVLQLGLGLLAGLAMVLMVFAALLQRLVASGTRGQAPLPVMGTMASLLVYALLMGGFITVGLGSLRARRWVRPVVLGIAWPALFKGLLSMALMVWLLPQSMEAVLAQQAALGGQPGSRELTAVVLKVGMLFAVAVNFLLYVGIPVLHLALYRNPGVQRTCDQRDPTPRWTDGRPLTVVGVALWLAFLAVMMLLVAGMRVFLLFGVLVTGLPAVAAALVTGLAAGVLAWLVSQQRAAGLWGTGVLVLALVGSALVPLPQSSLIELSTVSGLVSEAQVSQLRPTFELLGRVTPVMAALWGLAALAVLWFSRSHFRARA